MNNIIWKVHFVKEGTKVKVKSLMDNKGEFGIGTILSIATAIIVAAFVLVPGVKDFAAKILASMTAWWEGSGSSGGVSGSLFQTS